jgi:hypothetical protein
VDATGVWKLAWKGDVARVVEIFYIENSSFVQDVYSAPG